MIKSPRLHLLSLLLLSVQSAFAQASLELTTESVVTASSDGYSEVDMGSAEAGTSLVRFWSGNEAHSQYDNCIDPLSCGGRTEWTSFSAANKEHWYLTKLDANSSYMIYWFYSDTGDDADLDTGGLSIDVVLYFNPYHSTTTTESWPNYKKTIEDQGDTHPIAGLIKEVTFEGIWADQTGRLGESVSDAALRSGYRWGFTYTPVLSTWYFIKVTPIRFSANDYYALVIRQLGTGDSDLGNPYGVAFTKIKNITSEVTVSNDSYVNNATMTTIIANNLFINGTQITTAMLAAMSATQMIFTVKDNVDPAANDWSFEIENWNVPSSINANLAFAEGMPIIRMMPDSELTPYAYPLPGLAVGLDRGAQVRLSPGETWGKDYEIRVLAIMDIQSSSGTLYTNLARENPPLFGVWNRRIDNRPSQWFGDAN